MGGGIRPGEHRRAIGTANGAIGIMAGAPDTFTGEAVHRGGEDIGVSGAMHVHAAHLVGEYEKNIGAG